MKFVRALLSQDRAVANARSAPTSLSRQRVERLEVELFLDGLQGRRQAALQPSFVRVVAADHAPEVMPR